jgi:hypothetical protein
MWWQKETTSTRAQCGGRRRQHQPEHNDLGDSLRKLFVCGGRRRQHQPEHNMEAEGASINQSTMISEIRWENCSYVEAEGDSINQSIIWRQKGPVSTRA